MCVCQSVYFPFNSCRSKGAGACLYVCLFISQVFLTVRRGRGPSLFVCPYIPLPTVPVGTTKHVVHLSFLMSSTPGRLEGNEALEVCLSSVLFFYCKSEAEFPYLSIYLSDCPLFL
jgi:hypothetical protein